MSDPHELIEILRSTIEQIDDWRLSEISSPVEHVEVYAAIEAVPRELGVLVASLRHDAIVAMHRSGRAQGRHARSRPRRRGAQVAQRGALRLAGLGAVRRAR